MELTNLENLPQSFYNACKSFEQEYKAGRGDTQRSVTQLIDSPYYVQLQKQHWDSLTEDVSERIWSLFGSAVHLILERGASKNALNEERLFTEIAGMKISGQADYYEDEVLSDYKVTSVWKVIHGAEDWTRQLNVLAYLLELHGFPVKKLQIVAILRDYSKSKAAKDPNYPQRNVIVYHIDKWTPEKTIEYIKERIKLHAIANPPPCSDEERWHKEDVYAVMKKGRKSAVKLYDSKEEAETRILTEGSGFYLQIRPGEDSRCLEYCVVGKAGLCPYHNQYLDELRISMEE